VPEAFTPFPSNRAAFLDGVRTASGAPMLVLAGSYLGFGGLVRESGAGLGFGLLSSLTIWALPGQLLLLELYTIGASALVILMAVSLTNVRLLPMTLTLGAEFDRRAQPRWQLYVAAAFIAVTSWAMCMQRFPTLPPAQRMPFFAGCAVPLWGATITCTAIGFVIAGALPGWASLGLVFLNPIYFMLIFVGELRRRGRAMALCMGAAAGPALHLLSPDWGLLLAGVLAGTLAFAIDRGLARA